MNFALLFQLVRRDLAIKHRGALFGYVWFIAYPLIFLLFFTLLFADMLASRWGHLGAGDLPVTIYIYSGLIVYSLFAEILSQSVVVIQSNPNYIKKVIFPVEILPMGIVMVSLVHWCVNLLVLVGMALAFGGADFCVPCLLLAVSSIVLLAFAAGWIFALLGLFIKDSVILMPAVVQLLLFVSPVFFSVAMLSDRVGDLLWLNPLVPLISGLRGALFSINESSLLMQAGLLVAGALLCIVSLSLFRRLKVHFADVI